MRAFGHTPTAVELALEAAARRYRADPIPEAWEALYAACTAALSFYGRLPGANGRGTSRAQQRAVLADLKWRGIAVRPDHAAAIEGGGEGESKSGKSTSGKAKKRTRTSHKRQSGAGAGATLGRP